MVQLCSTLVRGNINRTRNQRRHCCHFQCQQFPRSKLTREMKLLKTRILVGKDKDDNGGEEEVEGELEGKVKEALAEATFLIVHK